MLLFAKFNERDIGVAQAGVEKLYFGFVTSRVQREYIKHSSVLKTGLVSIYSTNLRSVNCI